VVLPGQRFAKKHERPEAVAATHNLSTTHTFLRCVSHIFLTVLPGQRVPKDTSTLKLPRNGDRLVLWNYDIPSSRMNINLYGSHPFIMAVEPGGPLLLLLCWCYFVICCQVMTSPAAAWTSTCTAVTLSSWQWNQVGRCFCYFVGVILSSAAEL
jgi:hypothetical protein